ncbi:MAG: MATE family efflux transporter [Lachnospiraceae bacterium]|nr:MATE family efflux transporter [Lachnospiraceae bacterium]
MKKEHSMLHGRILLSIVIFALPLLGSSIVQQLYNTADLLFVSNFAGKTAAAAVGASGLIFTCLIGICTGLSVGVNILVANAVGQGKMDYARYISRMAVIISVITGLVLMVLGLVLAEPVLRIMQTPDNIVPVALVYLRTYLVSMPFMVIYNMGSSVMRGFGNSKTPFLILVAGGCFNILADFLLVAVLKMGVFGAALATLICQGICAILVLWVLVRKKSAGSIAGKWCRPDSLLLRKIFGLSIPVAIQAIVVTLSNIIVQSHINAFGEDTIAAFTAYFRIECFLYLPLVAVGQAMTTFAGQNAGAGQHRRIRQGAISAAIACGVFAFLLGLVLVLNRRLVFGWFLQDAEVLRIGGEIVSLTFPLYWLYGVLEVFSGSMKGLGRTVTSMCITFGVLCAGRVAYLFVTDLFVRQVKVVAAVYPLTWGCAALLFMILFFMYNRKLIRSSENGKSEKQP